MWRKSHNLILFFVIGERSDSIKDFSSFKPEEGAKFPQGNDCITAGYDWHLIKQQSKLNKHGDSDLDLYPHYFIKMHTLHLSFVPSRF